MLTETIKIINKRGLHARAAAKFATTAAQFGCRTQARTNGNWIDAKSVMSLMLLAATQGTDLEVSTEGDDEASAMQAIRLLIEARFEEDE
jgi:phosphotransferase system HPr (HPr) family protein